MISYIKHIRENNMDAGTIYLILDNAGYNRAYAVKEAAEINNIELIYLPPYCPNLNLIERLWKYFKKKIMKNKYYQYYNEFKNAVNDFFRDLHLQKEDLKSLLTLNFGIIKAC
jgi:transposase